VSYRPYSNLAPSTLALEELQVRAGARLRSADQRRGLNALPQFITEINGLTIQFTHVKSPQQNAFALIITLGWPGSVIEMLNVVGPLSDQGGVGREVTASAFAMM